jgi:gliding motility-associated-like protein
MKNNYLSKSLVFLFFFIGVVKLNAQPGCPSVNAGNNVTLPCGTNCTNLTATYFNSGNTDSYAVSTIPYTPFSYTAGTSILVNQDDIWSGVINLPFTFCFFGQAYNQVVVGANGLITFDVSRAGQTCVWSTTGTPNPTLPSPALYTNSIMGVYHDIDPSLGGTIKYQIIGTAPCRMFIVSYNAVPMFDDVFLVGSCWNITKATHQIVLYETTNVIEVYVKDKEACTGWNSGLATIGIQNAAGTVAYVAPGKNNSVWNATNQAWRFTPNGTSIVNISWLANGNQIGTGSTIQVCPSAQTTYTAQATYTPCAGGTPVVVTSNVTVSLAGTLQTSITSTQNVSCFGANNGSITASVSGGQAPVTYGWSNGSNSLSINNLSPGTYVFTANDGLNCVRRDTVIITEPPQLVVNVPNVSQTNCAGTGTGTLVATVTGGTGPYNFSWNSTPVQTDSILDNVAAGTYTITVTDSKGCTATDPGTLTIQAGGNNVVLNNPTISNVTCFGAANGSITANASGGSGVYSYNWSGGLTTNPINNLNPGSYSVTVNDGAGCTASATYNITEPAQLVINAPNITNLGCGGGPNSGSITANVTGGTTPYTYSWFSQSGGQSYSGQTISNLSADTYNLTVTDGNTCSATAAYQVTQAPALTYTQTSTNVTCHGGNNGSATINITGGTAPYQFNWNGTGNTSNATINGLTAGTVNVTVTDANCTVTTNFIITEPTPVVVALQNQTNVSCYNGTDGALAVLASGGDNSGSYTYVWSNGGNTNAINGLAAGTYTVTCGDASACTATATYTITQPTQLVLNAPTIQNIGCNGGNVGSITANPSGSNPPYSYNWTQQSNSQTYTGQTISNLSSDNYAITVTDQTNCSVSATYQVTQVTPLIFTPSFSNVSCYGGNNGSALITVTSGTTPYQYNWNGTGNTTNNTLNNLSAGTVNVTVTDANCSGTATINISQPTPILISLLNQENVLCNGGSDGTLTVNATGGTPGPFGTGYTYNWSNGQTGVNATGLAAGNYTIVVTDGNSCTASQSYTITEPLALSVSTQVIDATCYQGANGSITATAAGGTPPYVYLWSDGQTTATATALVSAQYTVKVTDASGCSVSTMALVNEPPDMLITTSATAVKCIGDKNGTISVSATGATPPFNYSATQDFSNFFFASNGVIVDLAAGDYTVVVSDNNGCTKTVPVTVPDATPDAFVTTTDSTSCYGSAYSDGAAHITATSVQNGPYLFAIDEGSQQYSGDFFFLSEGTHTITATNYHGCVADIPVTVYQPLPVLAEVIPDSLILPLGGTGQVMVTYQNAGTVTYNWTPSEGLSCIDCPNPTVQVYNRKDYVVTVSYDHGLSTCFGTARLHVDVLPELPVYIPNSFTPNGDGNNDVFEIYGQGIKEVNLTIFNRWGELVYKTNSQYAGWDGTYKGELQLPQVFTYHAVITFLNDKKLDKTGSITLVR